jgi:SAM-dependent methyltransferase
VSTSGALRRCAARVKRKLSHSTPRSIAPENPLGGVRLFPGEVTIPMPNIGLRSSVGPPGAFTDVALTTIGRMNMAGLRPDHDVLDIGCGVGRTARYLCDYLDSDARYEGFDITEAGVEWCQEHITPLFPNFHFRFSPLSNTHYSPDQTLPSAARFEFPYPDEAFDFVFAHSVFTHLLPDVTGRYLSEIGRVLRPGGISYSTWFLFDGGPGSYVHPIVGQMHRDPSGTFAVHDPGVPETAVGYSDPFVRQTHATSGLSIVEPIHPGFTRLQDAIVAVK